MYVGKQDSAVLRTQDKRIERLERKNPFGPWMTWEDYLRGFKDDFFGDGILGLWSTDIVGAGSSIALVDGAHGGWVRLTAGAAAARWARLWLGDNLSAYDTLDADQGWIAIARFKLNAVTNVIGGFGARRQPAAAQWIQCQLDTASGANWAINSTDAVANTDTQSAVAADTDWHWHVINVYPITGGRQVDYYLDGGLIASKTTNIPTIAITPFAQVYSRGAAARYMDLDYIAWIPRNL